MRKKKHFSKKWIGSQFAFVAMAVMFIVISCLLYLKWMEDKDIEQKNRIDRYNLLIEVAENRVDDDLYRLDFKNVDENIEDLFLYDEIVGIEIMDSEGNSIIAKQKEGMSSIENTSIYSRQLSYNFKKLGIINITMNDDITAERIKRDLIAHIVELFAIFSIVIISSILIGRKIANQVIELEKAVDLMASGDYDNPVEITSTNELGSLANKIEDMRLRILDSRERLNSLNLELEKKVENRTEQLIKTNEYLEEMLANIQEVQAELIVKNNELEVALDELTETREELIQSAKLNLASEVVAGVAHEINTPIGIALTLSTHLSQKTQSIQKDYLNQKLSKKGFDQYIGLVNESVKTLENNLLRAAELISDFKQVAVDQSGKVKRRFELKEYIETILANLYPKYKKTKHSVKIDIPEKIFIDGYPGALSQLITNLIMNTLVHGFENKEEGEIIIEGIDLKDKVRIIYIDNGVGIDEKIINKIFDPFFTTKKEKGGSGLGLSIVYNLVTQVMGGTIKCKSKINQGTKFIIEFDKIQR